MYGGVFALMGLSATALWLYAVVLRDLVPAYARSNRLLFSLARFGAGCVVYVVGSVVALYNAPASLLVYAAISIYYVAPVLPGPFLRAPPPNRQAPIRARAQSR
jgi:hypothetical protein